MAPDPKLYTLSKKDGASRDTPAKEVGQLCLDSPVNYATACIHRLQYHWDENECGVLEPYYHDPAIYENTGKFFGIVNKENLRLYIEKMVKNYCRIIGAYINAAQPSQAFVNAQFLSWTNQYFFKPPSKERGKEPSFLDLSGRVPKRAWLNRYAPFDNIDGAGAVLELILIYRSFDWENDHLIYTGPLESAKSSLGTVKTSKDTV